LVGRVGELFDCGGISGEGKDVAADAAGCWERYFEVRRMELKLRILRFVIVMKIPYGLISNFRFHGIYWPAFLIAAGFDPPKQIFCHSHWTVEGKKMSKSLGNVVDPFELKEVYETDGLRYFLLREGTPHSDANFTREKMHRMLNAELADTLGNLLSRCGGKAVNPGQKWPEWEEAFGDVLGEHGAALRASLESLPG
jgi:hypothetical protein